MPTQEEIAAEIEALRTAKKHVPATSGFGEDNHAIIDGQIAVLEEDLTATDIDERWYDAPDEEYHSAMEALDWKLGRRPRPPSGGWSPFIPDGEA